MKDYISKSERIGREEMTDKQTAILGVIVLVMFCYIIKLFVEGM